MDPEKRDRIINSAFKEFSFNSYQKASTNKIVADANISKGLLFHYFSSKQVLHEHLRTFAINLVVNKINTEIDWENGDFFERIKKIVAIKMEVTHQYPHIYDFIINFYKEKTIDEIKEMSSKEFSPDLLQKVYADNIDYSLFNKDIDIKKAMSIINWTLEKFGEEFLKTKAASNKPFDLAKIEEDMNGYIEILKRTFYK